MSAMPFATEEALVSELVRCIPRSGSPWRSSDVTTEFYYGDGWSDVLIFHEGEVVAIEAKLTKWRDALHQAYRNTSFAHRSFVCLPVSVAERAAQFGVEFARRGVGLCTVLDGRIVVVQDAPLRTPLIPWIASAAIEAATRRT